MPTNDNARERNKHNPPLEALRSACAAGEPIAELPSAEALAARAELRMLPKRVSTCGTRAVIQRGLSDFRVVCATCEAGGSVRHWTRDAASHAAGRDSGRACRTCGGARGKLAHSTFIRHREGADGSMIYAVTLHGTPVVEFLPNGNVLLDTGGWQTFTTRDRMNRCGVCIGMRSGIAYVRHHGREYLYADGMILRKRGGVSYTRKKAVGSVADAIRRRRRALRTETEPYWEWRWPIRSGGFSPYSGNAPEAFFLDSIAGL